MEKDLCRWASACKPRRLLTLTFWLCAVPVLSAGTLQSQNPFLPPGYSAAKPEPPKPVIQANGPISREVEFRGLFNYNGIYQFSIYDKTKNKGYWLTEGRSEGGITVRAYDESAQSITVNMNGRSERLTLMSASDAPLPVITSVNQPAQATATPAALPPGMKNANNNNNKDSRRVVPRRRVILPKN